MTCTHFFVLKGTFSNPCWPLHKFTQRNVSFLNHRFLFCCSHGSVKSLEKHRAFIWFVRRKTAEEKVVESEETLSMSESYYRVHSACHPALCTSIPRIQVFPEQSEKVKFDYDKKFRNSKI